MTRQGINHILQPARTQVLIENQGEVMSDKKDLRIKQAIQLLTLEGLTNPIAVRNYFIKREFQQRRKRGEKSKDIITSLSEKYFISESSINSVVYSDSSRFN